MRIVQTGIVVLILLAMADSMISGVILSRHVLSFLPIKGGRSFARNLLTDMAEKEMTDEFEKEISMWEQEHRTLLEHIAPNEFDILHYGAIAELKRR